MKEFLKRNRYYLYLLYIPIYLAMFFLVEHVIDRDYNYWVSYVPFDDIIPFVDWFVIFYVIWYPILIGVGLILLLKDKAAYERYFFMIMTGFTASILFFFIMPNGQDLRPETFERENIFTKMISMLYASDTNTNVLPSMHVYGSLCAMIALIDSDRVNNPWLVWGNAVVCVLICASTCFIKQHSILDAVAAVVMCVPLYVTIYWKRLFSKQATIFEKTNSIATVEETADEILNMPEVEK